MTIRSKLLLSYSVALAVALTTGAVSTWTIFNWRATTEKLSTTHTQQLRAERLRADIFREVSYGLAYLQGSQEGEELFNSSNDRIEEHFNELEQNATSETEDDHILGLRETHFELVWLLEGFMKRGLADKAEQEVTAARIRLDEIADEVTDDVAVLGQYYRELSSQSLRATENDGRNATYLIGAVALAALFVLLIAVSLMRRWLGTPLEKLSQATERLSGGDFTTRLSIDSSDEWGKLADEINHLAGALEELDKQARSKERLAALGEVAAYAAHNIRNPLAGVRAAAQVTVLSLQSGQTEIRESLMEIISAVDRLDIWVQRMMGFAKPLSYLPAPADINHVMCEALSLSRRTLETKKLTMRESLAPGLPTTMIDSVLLEQAINAAVNNACDATPEGGVIGVETSLVQDEFNKSWIRIEINDTGEGLPPGCEDDLFKLFVSAKTGGAGLGLAQAKRILEVHGGEISITNRDGAGASFVALLPVSADLDTRNK